MDSPSRMIWLDALRLSAGLSMVVLHATADPQGQPWPAYPVEDRVAPLTLRTIVYSARTELFILISLFLLTLSIDRRPRPFRAVAAEQSRRLIPPFLFWLAVFALFNQIKAVEFGYLASYLDEAADPATWARWLLLGEVKYHMHFLPTLLPLTLAVPLYLLAFRHPALGLLVILGLLAKWHLDRVVWSTFWEQEALPWLVRAVKIGTYIGYGMAAGAAAGLWARRDQLRLARLAPLAVLSLVPLLLIKAQVTRDTLQTGEWQFTNLAGYWADFLMPVVLFVLCMCPWRLSWPPILSRLAPYSFGIYLCHPIFLDLAEILLRDSGASPITQVGIKIAMALSGAALLTWALSRSVSLGWTIGLGPLPWRPRLVESRSG